MTVTGTTSPASSKTCVIPNFFPQTPPPFPPRGGGGPPPPGARDPRPYNILISTSTPADNSNFINASIVCCVGSTISKSLLWVRISNCSRDFLSTCGLRKTQYLSIFVGRGIGPGIRPPPLPPPPPPP